jgi:hypothetical protein
MPISDEESSDGAHDASDVLGLVYSTRDDDCTAQREDQPLEHTVSMKAQAWVLTCRTHLSAIAVARLFVKIVFGSTSSRTENLQMNAGSAQTWAFLLYRALTMLEVLRTRPSRRACACSRSRQTEFDNPASASCTPFVCTCISLPIRRGKYPKALRVHHPL